MTLWIHPFINMDCPSWDQASRYVVRDAEGRPALTSWWQGAMAGYFDLSRPAAARWWTGRVLQLRDDYGVDSFKIDAGESNWLPPCYAPDDVPGDQQPNGFSQAFVRSHGISFYLLSVQSIMS